MSRKFRWFLLASCAFVVLMGGGDAIRLLLAGPQAAGTPSGRDHVSAKPHTTNELARGEARQP